MAARDLRFTGFMDLAKQPQRIVVGVDFSDLSNGAFSQGFIIASGAAQGELHLVSIVDRAALDVLGLGDRAHPPLVEAADRLREELTNKARSQMAAYHATHASSRAVPTFVHVRVGKVADEIVQLAIEIGADLVVVGTHGRKGFERFLVGSVAERVVRYAPCPVLVVRPKDEHAMDEVPLAEPACEDCLATRKETEGRQWWCEPHRTEPREFHFYARSYRLDDAGYQVPYK